MHAARQISFLPKMSAWCLIRGIKLGGGPGGKLGRWEYEI